MTVAGQRVRPASEADARRRIFRKNSAVVVGRLFREKVPELYGRVFASDGDAAAVEGDSRRRYARRVGVESVEARRRQRRRSFPD